MWALNRLQASKRMNLRNGKCACPVPGGGGSLLMATAVVPVTAPGMALLDGFKPGLNVCLLLFHFVVEDVFFVCLLV